MLSIKSGLSVAKSGLASFNALAWTLKHEMPSREAWFRRKGTPENSATAPVVGVGIANVGWSVPMS